MLGVVCVVCFEVRDLFYFNMLVKDTHWLLHVTPTNCNETTGYCFPSSSGVPDREESISEFVLIV